mmetsp:Transcript_28373/g.31523  ORF Transcript_28373/g.31523 Transcript_28373/m.31523 type:complete len:614 (+) Transcript_28373:3-1844(+)
MYAVNEELFSFLEIPKEGSVNIAKIAVNNLKHLDALLADTRAAHYFDAYLKSVARDPLLSFYYDCKENDANGVEHSRYTKHQSEYVASLYFKPKSRHSLVSLLPSFNWKEDDEKPEDIIKELFPIVVEELIKDVALFKDSKFVNLVPAHIARVMLRNNMGRYVWDCELNWTKKLQLPGDNSPLPPPNKSFKSLSEIQSISRPSRKRRPDAQSSSEETLLAVEPSELSVSECSISSHNKEKKRDKSNVRSSVPDSLQEDEETRFDLEGLLVHLGSSRRDILKKFKGNPLNQPSALPSEFDTDIYDMNKRLVKQAEEDRKAINARKKQSSNETWAIQAPPPAVSVGKKRNTQLLLSHLGFFSRDNRSYFSWVDTHTQQFKRLLNQLDSKIPRREMIKVGLIYVRNGQEHEKELMRNDYSVASPQYQEFVQAMATIVNLEHHKGYYGHLEKDMCPLMPYYANSTLELAFHEVVGMVTLEREDKNLLRKKRHVGNDPIHIIWTEHIRKYSPMTIVSQFNDAHIIVYPLPNGLFGIQIAKKPRMPHFGPLVHNAVVSKETLPILVRQTAISANKVVRKQQENYTSGYYSRKNEIKQIIQKFKQSKDYYSYIADFMNTA